MSNRPHGNEGANGAISLIWLQKFSEGLDFCLFAVDTWACFTAY